MEIAQRQIDFKGQKKQNNFGKGKYITEKCTILRMKTGKIQTEERIVLPSQEHSTTLWEKKTYKFLGTVKTDAIKQAEMKKKEKERVLQRNEVTSGN